MRIGYDVLPSCWIFNACDPCHLWNVSRHYPDWLDGKYDGLRDILRGTFVREFDALTGHYTRLRASIARDGILNPIIVTERPQRFPMGLSCEYLGGSRLMIAQELDMDIPCIIEGRGGVKITLQEAADMLPGHRIIEPFRVVPDRWLHMPDNYDMKEQQRCRRLAKVKQIEAWQRWKEQNMS